MRRLELDSIAVPRIVFPQHLAVAHKVLPRGAELAELCRVLGNGVAEGDVAVPHGEGHEALEQTRDGESDRPMGGTCRQQKRGCIVEGVVHSMSGSYGRHTMSMGA